MRQPEDASISLRDAESLFRTKPIAEIRNVEATTKHQIAQKQEELRQLVGNRYRDLIDSADSILSMKSSSQSISQNFAQIDAAIRSLAPSHTPKLAPNPARARLYSVASRVKYLVDTTENIWGCLDESMFLEASGRYLRAKVVHHLINSSADREFLSNFPLLKHQWQIVESFKSQISQRARERLMDQGPGIGVGAYADALSAVSTIDELGPAQSLTLFLDCRRSWISQNLSAMAAMLDAKSVSEFFCNIVRIIQMTLGQVGELFLQVLNDMPLFYKTVLGSPPGSQLFGGIPNPDEEVRLWKSHREKLESVMVMVDPEFVAQTCSSWLNDCGSDIVSRINGKFLIDVIQSGEHLGSTEKLIRGTLDSREALEGSLEWLRSVFGSEIESPWNRICELVLREDKDLWDEIFEEAFVRRMKEIIDLQFDNLNSSLNLKDAVQGIVGGPEVPRDFSSYLKKAFTTTGVWFSDPNGKRGSLGSGFKAMVGETDFRSCLNAYLGPEVSQIKDLVDSRCESILEDLLCFLDSSKSLSRLKELAPYLQEKCYKSISTLVKQLEDELGHLSSALGNRGDDNGSQPLSIIVQRSLFIGRLLFALRNHSSHIPLILGSPRLWLETGTRNAVSTRSALISRQSSVMGFDSPVHSNSSRRQSSDSLRRQSSSAAAALFGVEDSASPKLEELSKVLRDLCIRAHNLWITWFSDELSVILGKDLEKDESLSATTPLRGWEETVIKQEQSGEGELEMKISLPSMPSLYITSFLFNACQEIHKVGGHVVDKFILQIFAFRLLEKVVDIYEEFISALGTRTPPISEKGILQMMLDLQFTVNILSGGRDPSISDVEYVKDTPKSSSSKTSYRQKMTQDLPNSARRDHAIVLINTLSKNLDPIDWATYESYLWDNEKQSYQRYAVLFGFLVQLNRMYTDFVQKLPSNTESNIMRCSTVPRFKYLPISAPVLSSRAPTGSALSSSPDDLSRSSWKAYSNGELSPQLGIEDTSSFGVATPLLKSFMTQVGSRFGESTLKLGSMLTDSQVGRLTTFGDMLPVQAAGLLSSFTAGAGRSDY
ncbi:conserved oligomeric Golgi complex subunit 1 [Aristolochia californica]|uniref:conserved oligomeric Golgi complex subunit 1 n=1 Tax=Aristolochia californica TaxID=171875 RepID=UPI0035D62011